MANGTVYCESALSSGIRKFCLNGRDEGGLETLLPQSKIVFVIQVSDDPFETIHSVASDGTINELHAFMLGSRVPKGEESLTSKSFQLMTVSAELLLPEDMILGEGKSCCD